MQFQKAINFFDSENQETKETPETPELLNTDYKEYDDLNGYYVKIIYVNEDLSIIMYNIDSLEGIRYEIKINIKELIKISKIFQQLGRIDEIYKIIIDSLDENKFEITQKINSLKFTLKIEDSQNKEIGFILHKNNKDNKNEYIKILSDSIIKLRINNKSAVFGRKAFTKIDSNKESLSKSINSINSINTINRLNKINTNNINEGETSTPTAKEFHLNCSKCSLMPLIHLNSSDFPFIQIECPNKHKEKKINLLNFFESGKKFSKEDLKCCKEFKKDSNLELYYCHDCKKILCQNCFSEHNKRHKIIFEELKNYFCKNHQSEYMAFCKGCIKNLCKECINDHTEHEIQEFDKIKPSKEDFKEIIMKKESIILNIEKINKILDDYKDEFIQKIENLKNFYNIEKDLFEEIINCYSKGIYNYEIIYNLKNITDFKLDDILFINSKDSFPDKTEKILKFFNMFDEEYISHRKIQLIKNVKMEETIYSLCYLKKHNIIAMGLDKKINLIDLKFNLVSSNEILDGKIAYIYELKDGKIAVVDLNKFIKILEIKDGKLAIYKKIESKEEKNFVITELSNKNIICGGDQYLTIIAPSFLFKYSIEKSIDLGTFISNIVELDEDSFLVGLSHDHKILIYSSKGNKELSQIENIYLRGNNYSISKISDDFVGIAGWVKSINRKACIYIFSIEKKSIFQKYIINDIESCMVVAKLSNKKFITAGTGLYIDNYSDLALLNYKGESKEFIINKIGDFKRGYCDTIEAIITFNDFIIASDSSSNLKIWTIE